MLAHALLILFRVQSFFTIKEYEQVIGSHLKIESSEL